MHGLVTRESVGRAALVTLAPRIASRRAGQEACLVGDAVKEVLYGVRLRRGGANGVRGLSERLSGDGDGQTSISRTVCMSVWRQIRPNPVPSLLFPKAAGTKTGTELARMELPRSDARDRYPTIKRAVMMPSPISMKNCGRER